MPVAGRERFPDWQQRYSRGDMAYTVLARRYRSSTFDEVVGQAHIAQTLKKAIVSGRIAHAFLFCGTRGTGKTSVARILAKALNCLSAGAATPTPCGKCSSCEGIARGDDLDYIEIDAASHTGVNNVREVIIGNSAYRPARCRYKIYLIDEVHMLSNSSFNALLKTLEEPPEHVKFILATTEAEKIPNTILSRCQRYDFKNISTREVAAHLGKICRNEQIDAEDSALMMVARAGGGSMRDSISLLDRLLSVGEQKLTLETIEALLGLPRAEQLSQLVDAIAAADPGKTLQHSEQILSSGMSPDTLISGLVDHLHTLLLMRVCGEKTDLVDLVGVPTERLVEQSRRLDSAVLTQDIAVLEELRRQLRSGAGTRALMDATLVRLALADQFRSISELLAGVGPSSGSLPVAGAPAATGVGGTEEEKKKSVSPAVAHEEIAPPVTSGAAPAAEPHESPPPAALPTSVPVVQADDDDDLPRPGKVWDDSGPSLAELLAAQEGRAPASAPSTETAAVSTASLPQVWRGVLEEFRKTAPGLVGILTDATLSSVRDGYAVVSLPSSHQHTARLIEKETNRQKLAAGLSGAFGKTVGVRIVVEQEAPAPGPETSSPRTPAPPAAPPVVKPALRDVLAKAASEPPRPLASPDVPGASVVKLTDTLLAELREDDLIRGVMELLGGQVVKVTEE